MNIDRPRAAIDPALRDQFVPRHRRARVPRQDRQQVGLDRRKPDDCVIATEFLTADVEIELADRNHGVGRRHRIAPEDRLDAKDQLARFERFGHIVIRAAFQPLNAVFRFAHRRQQQDRHA